MSFKNKKTKTETILASSTAPQSVVIKVEDKRDFAIALNHGTGSATTAKLQASLDGTNYVDVDDTSVTLSTSADTVIWNVTDFMSPYCKLVITGDAVTCIATLTSSL